MPPSDATSQYPFPVGVAAIPTIGCHKWMAPVEPWKRAAPKLNTPPSLATSQNPEPVGSDAMPTTGMLSVPLSSRGCGALPRPTTLGTGYEPVAPAGAVSSASPKTGTAAATSVQASNLRMRMQPNRLLRALRLDIACLLFAALTGRPGV